MAHLSLRVKKDFNVNDERYREMLTDCFFHEIEAENLVNIWFQQDGCTCHTANATISVLRLIFGNRIISKNGVVNWPPRSCDLTSLSYYLWGAVKAKCYANSPQTNTDLKGEIHVVISKHDTNENALKNWVH